MAFNPFSGANPFNGFSPTNIAKAQLRNIMDPNIDLLPSIDNPFNNGGKAKAPTGAKPSNRDSVAPPQAPGNAPADPYTAAAPGSGSGRDPAEVAAELAELSAQENQLRDFLGSAGGQLEQGITGINDDVARLRNKNNSDRSRTLTDFDLKTQDTERAKDGTLDRIDTDARVQANSLRNIIGRSSGTGSSAYQITAPGAVAREASIDRQDVQEDFGANFRDLGISRKRADEDYTEAENDITRQGNDKTRMLREGVMSAQNDATGSIAEIARRRAAVQGGNPAAVGGGYDADISRRNQAISQLFNTYRTPVQAKAVQVDAPNLRDYVVDRAAIGGTQPTNAPAGTSPYSQFLQKKPEEEMAF